MTIKIPEGLVRCDVCGKYKGKTIERGQTLTVSCLCDGEKCTICKKNKLYRPISELFDEASGRILHVSHFAGYYLVCDDCKADESNKRRDRNIKDAEIKAAIIQDLADELWAKKVELCVWKETSACRYVVFSDFDRAQLEGVKVYARQERYKWDIGGIYQEFVYGRYVQFTPGEYELNYPNGELIPFDEWLRRVKSDE